jgi:hypothetical protein
VAYERIIKIMLDNLHSFAKEADAVSTDDKEQLNIHIMTVENMHHFHTELRRLNVVSLDTHIQAAKSQYDTHLNAYIKAVVRRPFGKLLEFFEGIDEILKTSAPEEVGFRMNYNKAALKKVIAMYPGKEIKKAVEVLYKRVDKHFSEDPHLLQVAWQGIQEECLRLYRHFELTMERCYPQMESKLLFSLQDLQHYFSEASKSH